METGNAIFFGVLVSLSLTLTVSGYALHRASLAFTSMAAWMVTCIWGYLEASGVWGIPMGIFWISIAMIITSGIEGAFLSRGEEKAEAEVEYTEALDEALKEMDSRIEAKRQARQVRKEL